MNISELYTNNSDDEEDLQLFPSSTSVNEESSVTHVPTRRVRLADSPVVAADHTVSVAEALEATIQGMAPSVYGEASNPFGVAAVDFNKKSRGANRIAKMSMSLLLPELFEAPSSPPRTENGSKQLASTQLMSPTKSSAPPRFMSPSRRPARRTMSTFDSDTELAASRGTLHPLIRAPGRTPSINKDGSGPTRRVAPIVLAAGSSATPVSTATVAAFGASTSMGSAAAIERKGGKSNAKRKGSKVKTESTATTTDVGRKRKAAHRAVDSAVSSFEPVQKKRRSREERKTKSFLTSSASLPTGTPMQQTEEAVTADEFDVRGVWDPAHFVQWGRWSSEDETKFQEGLHLYGRNWAKIWAHIGSKSTRVVDVRSHAQAFFAKLKKLNLPLPPKVAESGTAYTLSGIEKKEKGNC